MLGPWLWSGWKPRRFGSNLGGIFQSFRILGQWLCTWISKKWSDTWSDHVGPSHLALFSDLPQVFQVAIFESQLTRQWLDPKKRRKCPSLTPLMIFQCVIWPFCYSNDVKSPQNWQMQKKQTNFGNLSIQHPTSSRKISPRIPHFKSKSLLHELLLVDGLVM